MGHRRLSIIDLSEQGRQPMTNEDGTIHMVFNGEIYNYLELREELIAKGHHFASHTDSEVIIHAYEEYGVDSIKKLRGMFAYAIWDSRDGSLLLRIRRVGPAKPRLQLNGVTGTARVVAIHPPRVIACDCAFAPVGHAEQFSMVFLRLFPLHMLMPCTFCQLPLFGPQLLICPRQRHQALAQA